MVSLIVLGVAIWLLAVAGAALIAGPVGVVVMLVFFATAGVLGILAQRDLAENYVVIRKDERDAEK